MISKIRAYFQSTAIAKWVEVTTSNCREAAVVTAEQNQTGNTPNRCVFLFSPFMKVIESIESFKLLNGQ